MSTKTRSIVNHFRGEIIPSYVRTKSDLIRYILKRYRHEAPITNAEFVFDLRCTRFGGVIHDLRAEGWDIATVQHKENGKFVYYLVSSPDDDNGENRLRLV
tara:strand:- start:5223 stop:5525 length:303 start_codon:yes stop_codon:yes gene_type:complete